ncbi:hypothetical protein COR50_03730 [Chitinophaga caeni]|uniref:Uncharacterized protein n=1 Tax=Chitinophaga caeni TaxID=2029983 RepID=A0A291QR27_9BACT|nr:hypothetical protein COR50_03730 [Chitinophaga caeni]
MADDYMKRSIHNVYGNVQAIVKKFSWKKRAGNIPGSSIKIINSKNKKGKKNKNPENGDQNSC